MGSPLANVPNQKKAPVKGPSPSLIVPVSVLLFDDHGALTAILIPAAMQAAIVAVILRTGAAEVTTIAVVAVHVPVTADAHVKRLGARDRRGTNDNRGSNYKGELSHSVSFQ